MSQWTGSKTVVGLSYKPTFRCTRCTVVEREEFMRIHVLLDNVRRGQTTYIQQLSARTRLPNRVPVLADQFSSELWVSLPGYCWSWGGGRYDEAEFRLTGAERCCETTPVCCPASNPLCPTSAAGAFQAPGGREMQKYLISRTVI